MTKTLLASAIAMCFSMNVAVAANVLVKNELYINGEKVTQLPSGPTVEVGKDGDIVLVKKGGSSFFITDGQLTVLGKEIKSQESTSQVVEAQKAGAVANIGNGFTEVIDFDTKGTTIKTITGSTVNLDAKTIFLGATAGSNNVDFGAIYASGGSKVTVGQQANNIQILVKRERKPENTTDKLATGIQALHGAQVAIGGDETSKVSLDATYAGSVNGILSYSSEAEKKAGVTILGKDISVTAQANDESVGVVAAVNSLVKIGNDKTNSVKIKAINTKFANKVEAEKPIAYALWVDNTSNLELEGGQLEVTGKTVDIYAEGGNDVRAIHVASNDLNPVKRSSLKLSGDNVLITAKSTNDEIRSVGISAMSAGDVDVSGKVILSADNAVLARGDSKVVINGTDGSVITGDINFNYDEDTSKTPIDANVVLNLSGANSKWDGNTLVSWDAKPNEDKLDVNSMSLSLKDGATWKPTAINTTEAEENGRYLALNQLSLDGGQVDIKGSDIDVTVENVIGTGIVNLAVDGEKAGKFNVQDAAKEASLDVNLMDKDLKKELTADDVTPEAAQKLLANVGGKDADGNATIKTSTDVKEGLVNEGFGTDNAGNTVSAGPNTLMQSTLELASAAPLALNRIMMNDVRKRLGDIRTTEGTHGVWARYDGGKLSGDGGLKNDFNTIQVGIDTVPTEGSARMGVAFSYTDSDADYARGSADMKAYSIAMYGTKMFDNGMFIDVIGRMGTADTDLVVDGDLKGSMKNVALGVSGELGWRFDLTDMVFVEPQMEVSYAYVNDDKLTLGTASYDVDAVNSLLGRVGFAAGFKCPSNFGNIYLRASAVHEFLGDSEISGVNGNAKSTYEIDGKDTWFEYGIGANFNMTKNTYMWADVERTTGGALDEDWRATVGVRYAW